MLSSSLALKKNHLLFDQTSNRLINVFGDAASNPIDLAKKFNNYFSLIFRIDSELLPKLP